MNTLTTERPEDAAIIEQLCDQSFGGPDRRRKSSYAFRDGIAPVRHLCHVIRDGNDRPVASIRYWPILVGAGPALLLGPLAVLPGCQGQGHGRRLVRHTLDIAGWGRHAAVLLVGDPAYYQRLGFEPALPYGITIAGENPARVQVNWLLPDRQHRLSGRVRRADGRACGNADAQDAPESDRCGGRNRLIVTDRDGCHRRRPATPQAPILSHLRHVKASAQRNMTRP